MSYLGHCIKKPAPTRKRVLKSCKQSDLTANAEAFDQVLITGHIFAACIVQQLTTERHHFQKTTTRVVVFFVGFKMLCQGFDAGGQDCNLNFGGTGIARFGCIFFDKSAMERVQSSVASASFRSTRWSPKLSVP